MHFISLHRFNEYERREYNIQCVSALFDRVLTIDTRRDAEAGKALKRWWSEVGLTRLAAGSTGQFSDILFTVSREDWIRIQKLHANYYQEMRRIIASSESSQLVVLANLQLIPFEHPSEQVEG